MKTYKPTTPSRRFITNPDYRRALKKSKPHRALTTGFKRHKGRNSFGRITTRHRGGGHKRRYREVDFKMDKVEIPARVATIEYDPNRSGYIALVIYKDGERRYILAAERLRVGDEIISSENAGHSHGNRLLLKNIPVGAFVYNVELKPNAGARMARGAGTYAEVLAQEGIYTHLKLPSTEVRKVLSECRASVGEVSNSEHRQKIIGKAGRNRWLGRRPIVRGSAMNPVDHPYGGGEGKAGRGRRRAVSKWGKPTGKGQKTRRAKKYSNKLIINRRIVRKRRG